MPFAATKLDLEIITLSEVSQRQIYRLYVQSKKNDTNEVIYETEIEPQTWTTNLWLPKGKVAGGRYKLESGINIYTLLYIK